MNQAKRILIRGARALDPARGIDGPYDILIEGNKIKALVDRKAPSKQSDTKPDPWAAIDVEVIDASSMIVVPGLIDMHTHLREPGHEYKETIESGCMAAAHGGFAAVCSMANTNPVNDTRAVTEFILRKAATVKGAKVFPVGAVSRGLLGDRLAEYADLKAAGCVALSDDGNPVMNSQLMRRALEYAKGFGLPVISHCEDRKLTGNGVMNEGAVSTRLGLPGIPNASESIMVARDLALCELTKSCLHIAHVSTENSVRLVRDAKARGVCVTAETAPHYFCLTQDAIGNYDTNAKMSPPLRSERDMNAIREGLADGTIDVIATDHAPHSSVEKDVEFDHAANGIIGLETSLSLSLKLVHEGILTLDALIMKMSTNVDNILKLDVFGLEPGRYANLTIIDLNRLVTVNPSLFRSKSRNTPFAKWELKGKAILTMAEGNIVFRDESSFRE